MNILIDFRTIAAIVCLVLGVICIAYYFVYEKVRKWRKRRARTLLHDEIDGYKSQIKRLDRYPTNHSDEGFGRIIDFVLSSRVVNEAFGLSGAKTMGEF